MRWTRDLARHGRRGGSSQWGAAGVQVSRNMPVRGMWAGWDPTTRPHVQHLRLRGPSTSREPQAILPRRMREWCFEASRQRDLTWLLPHGAASGLPHCTQLPSPLSALEPMFDPLRSPGLAPPFVPGWQPPKPPAHPPVRLTEVPHPVLRHMTARRPRMPRRPGRLPCRRRCPPQSGARMHAAMRGGGQ